MLTQGDDYPLHQTAEPIAFAGTDRNFYDRYFFNGYSLTAGDTRMLAVAFGVYPQLDIVDAHVCWMANGRQVNLHAAARAGGERLLMQAGPVRIEVVEPLRTLRITVDAPDQGITADLTFTGRSFPIEEPRFTRRIGPRTLLDYMRLTQNGGYDGWVEVDGERHDVTGFAGTRDRSWGVRPVGARDVQPPPVLPQFFWLWSPCVFPDRDLFWHSNDDEHGRPWNRRGVVMPAGGAPADERAVDGTAELAWRPGTRAATAATLRIDEGEVIFTPVAEFMMLGLGYGHPRWAHGTDHGPLATEREDFATADLDRSQPQHFHIQALSEVRWTDAAGTVRQGRGVLEQLAIGAHAPSGFTGLADVTP
ncbi:hypothetical protein [Sphingomonas sp.]|uniref:hypothetical protein n=1 Tax=Sphingomonas sp. TaxID=28214 RepID=UPI003CC62A81